MLLAHRVLDGRGEWYLGAPEWVPLLPEDAGTVIGSIRRCACREISGTIPVTMSFPRHAALATR